jgi:hypothetical protein
MVQVYKILHGRDQVDKRQRIWLAAGNETLTRLATGVMNLVKPRFNMDDGCEEDFLYGASYGESEQVCWTK